MVAEVCDERVGPDLGRPLLVGSPGCPFPQSLYGSLCNARRLRKFHQRVAIGLEHESGFDPPSAPSLYFSSYAARFG